jgi:protein SCO1
MKRIILLPVIGLAVLLAAVPAGRAADPATRPALAQVRPDLYNAVRFDQKLGVSVPRDLPLIDDSGRSVSLGDYLGTGPVILVLARYRCELLCPEVLNGVVRGLQGLPSLPGRDYEWVVVSLDPQETPDLAWHKKQLYMKRYDHNVGGIGWHFLTGSHDSIERLADDVGCRFAHDVRTGSWAEPAGVILLTPGGRISSYLFGGSFSAQDLAIGLAAARTGEISAPNPKSQERCFPYDPTQTHVGRAVLLAIRLGSLLSVALLVLFVGRLLHRERRANLREVAP